MPPWGSVEEERGSGSRHSLCPGPADDESKASVGRGHCDRYQALVMAFHLYLPHSELLRAVFPLSAFLPQKKKAVGMDRGSLWTWAQELFGDCCSGGTLKSAGLQAWKSLPNCYCTPLFPQVALYFPLRVAQPPFQSCFRLGFPAGARPVGSCSSPNNFS